MNYNILAYIIYLTVMSLIIYVLGKKLHSIGRIYIMKLFNDDIKACDSLNNVLLVAYYLFNIGYAFIKLHYWQYISNSEQLIYSLSFNIGMLLIILAFTHYLNVMLIYRFSKKSKVISSHKI